MLLRTADGGEREYRSEEFGSSAVPPPGGSSLATAAGIRVTAQKAQGLPAVGSAIRLIAMITASLPIGVYRGLGANRRPADKAWQFQLLHDAPNADVSPFDFVADLAAGPEACGNAFIQKIKFKGRVVELHAINPDYVRCERDKRTKHKLFRINEGGRVRTYDSTDILHVRGFTYGTAAVVGRSPIQVHQQTLGTALALDEFEGRFFTNNASPGGVIQVPGMISKTQAKEMLDYFIDSHAGTANSHKPAVLYKGATWNSIGVSLQDAQFIESQRYGVEQIGRIFDLPASLLGLGIDQPRNPNVEQDLLRFEAFGLAPRLRRIESAFKSDPDLFGPGDLYPQFDINALMRVDAKTKATVAHMLVQSGIWLQDEARAEFGLGPLPNGAGQIPQITPVGGAPNPAKDPVTDPEEN